MLFREMLDRFAVLIVQFLGNDDLHHHDLVALFFAALDSVCFDSELGSAAGFGGDGQGSAAVEGGDVNLCARIAS
jgi:hypothetical protein